MARPTERILRPPRQSRCPLRDRQTHTSKSPGFLTQSAVENIERQIVAQGYNPLPELGAAQRFYRCMDCYAVWPAGTRYERVTEKSVCGIYDHTLIWKPGMKRGRPKGSKDQVRPRSDELVMTLTQTCDFLRISRTTMYRLIKRGDVPYFQIGSVYRFNREAIDEWMDKG